MTRSVTKSSRQSLHDGLVEALTCPDDLSEFDWGRLLDCVSKLIDDALEHGRKEGYDEGYGDGYRDGTD